MHNVKGCWNSESCGIGCPTSAKQSMLVTTLPKALDAGATLLVQARALRVVVKKGRAVGVICPAVGMNGTPLAATTTRVNARHRVVAGGAIDSPPPLHPVMASTALTGFSEEQAQALRDFPRTHAVLALMGDGYNKQSPGDQVTLHDNGTPSLDYALNDYVRNAARRALLSRAEIQSTAGACHVQPLHQMARPYSRWQQACEAIAPFGARRHGVPHQHRRESATVRLRCGPHAHHRHCSIACRSVCGPDAGSGVSAFRPLVQ